MGSVFTLIEFWWWLLLTLLTISVLDLYRVRK